MPEGPKSRISKIAIDVGDVIDRKYELVRLLGEGGMGAVYEGRHRRLDRRCALKFLHPELTRDADMVTRLMREAKAAASIGSEHIIDVTDIGETDDGIPYVVMEYLEGEDLADVLDREGRIEPSRAAALLIQACRALSAAHQRGIVHRDLKPENLFLTVREDGTEWIKVLDFGIAKFKDSMAKDLERLTATGTTLGTPCYMSPEQARGAQDLDHLSDIFSMGTILYEMLTGRLPFMAGTYNELIIMIATSDPSPPSMYFPRLDEGLEKVVLKALSRKRTKRFQSMPELSDALQPYAYRLSTLPPEAQRAHLREIELARTALPAPTPDVKDIGDVETIEVETEPSDEETPLADAETLVADEVAMARPARLGKLIGIGSLIALLGIVVGVGFSTFGSDSEEDDSPVGANIEATVGAAGSDESTTGAANGSSTVDSGSAPASGNTSDASSSRDAEVAPARVEAASSVRLEVSVHPRHARITLDGREVDGNPYTSELPRDGEEHRIEATADGFENGVEVVVFDRSRTVEIELVRRGPRHRQPTNADRSDPPASEDPQPSSPRPPPEEPPPSSPRPPPEEPPSSNSPMPPDLRHIEDDNPYQ